MIKNIKAVERHIRQLESEYELQKQELERYNTRVLQTTFNTSSDEFDYWIEHKQPILDNLRIDRDEYYKNSP